MTTFTGIVYYKDGKEVKKMSKTTMYELLNERMEKEDIVKLVGNYDKKFNELEKELEVAKCNEEAYRLEMLDITKRLGLDEETLFDDVKDKAERLNNIINKFNDFIEEVYNHINLGNESEEFMLIFDKWQKLKGSDINEKI